MTDETETMQQTMSRFSHEIRNPVTLIHSSLQLLSSRYPQLQTDELWLQLQNDVQDIIALLNDFSLYQGHCMLRAEPADFKKLTADAFNSFQALAQLQKKSYVLHIDDTLPIPLIRCDTVKIRQVLINLIKNAFEATDAGGTIEVQLRHRYNRILLIISDNGHGMTDAQKQQIFTPFVTFKSQGSGLGLAVASQVINSHHGSIHVLSEPGKGSKFIVMLPVRTLSPVEQQSQ